MESGTILNTRAPRSRGRWPPAQILDAIRRWHELYGEPPAMTDWDPYRARQMGQEWRIARYDAGDWPSVRSVRNHFGRLSAAVAAAGLAPRLQGHRYPQQRPLLDDEIRLHLTRMRDAAATDADVRGWHARVADAVRDVAEAREHGEADDLRVSLIALAATAIQWADDATRLSAPGTAATREIR